MKANDETIFHNAIEILDPQEQRSFLEQACAGDDDLRLRVERLIAAFPKGVVLESPPRKTDVDLESTMSMRERVGDTIGNYKLLEVIGEGGMGKVYMAEQTSPVHRRVAVKVIKPGMDSSQVIARFEAERQALALMDHPNISKVYDAGSTVTGHPYFVMELVKGIPITQFCDQQQLDLESRLKLFQDVCRGVQHAHQKGIIHRDLKPSNVLVAMYDDRPVPKVIDFGVAKATGEKLTEKTMFTRFDQIVGTLEYMSPEQAQFNQLDIDTRSDVYSLGAILYELLVGEPPLDREKTKNQALDETLRMIREDEPTRPSTKVNTMDRLYRIAIQRNVSSKNLCALLSGDIDWIVMKALDKDRTRRYETPNNFAGDIQHYLDGEAVTAYPPSRAYRLKKFTRKYQGLVMAMSLIGATLLIGIVGTTIGLFQAKTQKALADQQRERAVDAEKLSSERSDSLKAQAKRLEAQKADLEEKANELKLILDFQEGILERIDTASAGKKLTQNVMNKLEESLIKADVAEPERDRQLELFNSAWNRINATDAARDLIDETILKPAVSTLDQQFADNPQIDAQLREALAKRYWELGLFDEGLRLQKLVLAKWRLAYGNEHRKTLNAINNTGVLLAQTGKLAEAERFFRESVELKRRILGDDDPDTLKSIASLGLSLKIQGKFAEAEPFFREALARQRVDLGNDHPSTISTIDNLGGLLLSLNQLTEAEALTLEALESKRRVFGEEHPNTIQSVLNLGSLLADQGKLDEAEPHLREALYKFPRVFGEKHPTTIIAIAVMAGLLERQNKLSEAESYLRKALDVRREILGEEHPDTLDSLVGLGVFLWRQGRFDEAEPLYREHLEKTRRVLGEENRATLISIGNLGHLLLEQGKLTEAEPLIRDALEKRRRLLGNDDPMTLSSILALAKLLHGKDKFVESTELLNSIFAQTSKSVTSENAWQHGALLMVLGKNQLGLEKFRPAEENLLEAHSIFNQNPTPTNRFMIECHEAIVGLYSAWHVAEPNQRHDEKATDWQRKLNALLPAKNNGDPEDE